MQYLRVQKKRKAGKVWDYLRFSWSNEKERVERWRAFLMFPMLYAIPLDDEKEELIRIKREIKRIHILIYLVLIVLIILGIYSEKVFA